jgi:hypothetical protein
MRHKSRYLVDPDQSRTEFWADALIRTGALQNLSKP